MSESTSPTEHKPWVGKEYTNGIDGQHIAIVLYSHYYGTPDEESADFTTSIIEDLICGKRTDPSLVKVQGYFGELDAVSFWPKVIFFNFLPTCIGTCEKMRERGTPLQITRAKERFIEILFTHQVNKVFVFTKRGWADCPATQHEETTDTAPLALSDEFPQYQRGTYTQNGHTVEAFGLEHPERASIDKLRHAVQFAMTLH